MRGPGGGTIRANVYENEQWLYVAPTENDEVDSSAGVPPNPYITSSHEVGNDEDRAPINHQNGVVGESLSAGPAITEGRDGERRIVSGGGAAESDL